MGAFSFASSGLTSALQTRAAAHINIGTLTAPYSGQNYSTYSSATCKSRHVATVACHDISVVYNSLQTATIVGTPEVLAGNDFEIKVSIEISGGTLIPVFFSGKRLILVKPGVTLFSDPVGIRLAAGEVFHVRTFINRIISNIYVDNVGEAGNFTANKANLISNVTFRGALFSSTEGVVFSSSTGVDPFLQDYTDSGVIAASNNQGYVPSLVLGVPEVSSPKSVVVIGDSISAGSGDTFGQAGGSSPTVNIYAGRGYWPRAFQDSYAISQIACGGEQIADFLGNAKSFYRFALASNSSTAIVALGTNDILASARTAAQVKADLLLLAAKIAPKVQKVLLCTLLPRTTSTDGWKTTGNQTTVTTNSFNSVRIDVNAWIRARTSGYDYIEVADLVESARDSGIWKAPGVALESGTATSGSGTTVVDTGKAWSVNQWTGYVCNVNNSNTQAGVIASNTSNTLTLTVTGGALSPVVGVGNTYSIHAAYTADGTHPSAYGYQQMATGISLLGIL